MAKAVVTDEERKRRSELAKKLVAEGKIGGAGRGQGRKRKPRVGEIVAEAANEEAQNIISVFRDAIGPDQKINVRLDAANKWVSIAADESKLQMQEDSEDFINNAGREELIGYIVQKLTSGQGRAALAAYFGAIPEPIDNEYDGPEGDSEQPALPRTTS